MKVKRIVADLAARDPEAMKAARAFYADLLGLELLMDLGWIATYGSGQTMNLQVSVAVQGGSDAPVPDLSVEVDDLDEALARVRQAGLSIEYGPTLEPWGVRRFFVRDPLGKRVNILAHA